MASPGALPRWLSSHAISSLINLFALVFLALNLLNNYWSLHENALGQYSSMTREPNDLPTVDFGQDFNELSQSQIGYKIPRGRAKAMPSVQISQEHEAKVR